MQNQIIHLRKKIHYQSWHRGTKEADMIFGPFADDHLETYTLAELKQLETILAQMDAPLMDWLANKAPAPANVEGVVFNQLKEFYNSLI